MTKFKVFAAAFAPDGRQAWGRGCGRTYEIAKKHAEREIVDLFRRERISADNIAFQYFEDPKGAA